MTSTLLTMFSGGYRLNQPATVRGEGLLYLDAAPIGTIIKDNQGRSSVLTRSVWWKPKHWQGQAMTPAQAHRNRDALTIMRWGSKATLDRVSHG